MPGNKGPAWLSPRSIHVYTFLQFGHFFVAFGHLRTHLQFISLEKHKCQSNVYHANSRALWWLCQHFHLFGPPPQKITVKFRTQRVPSFTNLGLIQQNKGIQAHFTLGVNRLRPCWHELIKPWSGEIDFIQPKLYRASESVDRQISSSSDSSIDGFSGSKFMKRSVGWSASCTQENILTFFGKSSVATLATKHWFSPDIAQHNFFYQTWETKRRNRETLHRKTLTIDWYTDNVWVSHEWVAWLDKRRLYCISLPNIYKFRVSKSANRRFWTTENSSTEEFWSS